MAKVISTDLIDCPGCGTLLSPRCPECPDCHTPLKLTFKRTREKPGQKVSTGIIIPWKLVAVILAGVYLWASPYLTLWNLKTAIQEKDSATLAAAVNFERVREDLKEKVSSEMAESVGTETGGLEMVGAFIASGITDKAIDVMVTKTNFKKLIKSGDGDEKLKGNVTTNYISWDRFDVTLNSDSAPATFNMERDGLTGWKIVGFDGELSNDKENGPGKALSMGATDSGMADRIAKTDLYGALDKLYLDCTTFWFNNGSDKPCTKMNSTNPDVTIKIIDDRRASFKANASHLNSDKVFTIDAGGKITGG